MGSMGGHGGGDGQGGELSYKLDSGPSNFSNISPPPSGSTSEHFSATKSVGVFSRTAKYYLLYLYESRQQKTSIVLNRNRSGSKSCL